ncbi:MAG TPA: 5'-deoxyadenosine deaminase [Vicinamibacterales bacterium]|nr:5'-deoxyadenosine deaminase [Vicinamibacterales bacterium]
MSTLITNAAVVTMNDAHEIVRGSVGIVDGRVAFVGDVPPAHARTRFEESVDAAGAYLLPGFIQTHIHLCQTLFRTMADDLPLLDWLRARVWPLEAAHDPATLRVSARLAAAELLKGGTTSVLTMETVHDTDAVFEAIEPTGLRATIGKCLMDADDLAPARLQQEAVASIDESLALHARWHGAAGGRLRVTLAPRFAVSCSRELLERVAQAADAHGLLVHTHASENREEVALVARLTGMSNLDYLASTGLATRRLCAAHCVWATDAEQGMMAERGVKVLHCPGSNLKLGSGIAPVAEMRRRGIVVSLGADGAACNNTLDMFQEMRLAATLQAVTAGPGALTAREALWMATRGGARTLGLEAELGSVEPGKRADLALLAPSPLHTLPDRDPYSTIVYGARASDVRAAWVDGTCLVREGRLVREDESGLAAEAREAAELLVRRALL